MNDENWPVEWLRQLKHDAGFFAEMVYAARKEMKNPVLKRAREDLEKTLEQEVWNKTVPSRAIVDWVKQVRKKLCYAGLELELTAEIIGKEKSSTRIAAKRACRLVARIDSSIGLVEKALNEKENP